jgi:hypothetical protein
MAISPLPTFSPLLRLGSVLSMGCLCDHRMSSRLLDQDIFFWLTSQLVAWACITSQTECQPQATEKGTDAGLAFLTTILESRERVDPVDGLGDLIMMSARALCQDRSVGGVMQRELGESLFRLVVPANNHIGESVSSGSSTIF